MNRCPKCGAITACTDSAGNPWFECGSTKTFTSATCRDRSPLAEQLLETENQLTAWKAYAERLEVALQAYRNAYTPDGHTAPYDCFATGPKTGDAYQDLVACPGCFAERFANEAKETKP